MHFLKKKIMIASCEFCVCKLEYLTKIFAQLNSVNTRMQIRDVNVLSSTDKLVLYKREVVIWENRTEGGNFERFPLIR